MVKVWLLAVNCSILNVKDSTRTLPLRRGWKYKDGHKLQHQFKRCWCLCCCCLCFWKGNSCLTREMLIWFYHWWIKSQLINRLFLLWSGLYIALLLVLWKSFRGCGILCDLVLSCCAIIIRLPPTTAVPVRTAVQSAIKYAYVSLPCVPYDNSVVESTWSKIRCLCGAVLLCCKARFAALVSEHVTSWRRLGTAAVQQYCTCVVHAAAVLATWLWLAATWDSKWYIHMCVKNLLLPSTVLRTDSSTHTRSSFLRHVEERETRSITSYQVHKGKGEWGLALSKVQKNNKIRSNKKINAVLGV